VTARVLTTEIQDAEVGMPHLGLVESALDDERLLRILRLPDEDELVWQADLDRLRGGDETLTRKSAGESSIKAVQRLLVFLGYSTASSGAFLVDGDFGRGTNRAVAQFQVEHGLSRSIDRETLCYACTWRNAGASIVQIPDARLTPATLDRMLSKAIELMNRNAVMCGSLDEALFHLDALHRRRLLTCKQILARYGDAVAAATTAVAANHGIGIAPQWLLAIIKQETSGIVRPRFEQHLLTRLHARHPNEDFAELRYRSMSMGLGQILGENFRKVGADSAHGLYTAPLAEQVAQIARFLAAKADVAAVAARRAPRSADFRTVARYYNGAGYETHHYHESLERWFREFKQLTAGSA
jgi:peptidoglycan hydrolase-like protein with peptidoglycan-binding domain